MRNLVRIQPLGTFTQGSIFSNFKDPNGISCNGLVISARCDIHNSKYDYASVLPLYSLKMYFDSYVACGIRDGVAKRIEKAIESDLRNAKLPADSLIIYGAEATIAALPQKGGRDKVVEKISAIQRYRAGDNEAIEKTSEFLSSKENFISELIKGRNQGLYLLERVRPNEESAGYVVDLRHPITLPMNLLRQVSLGLEKEALGRGFSMWKGLFEIRKNDICCFMSCINSPYIEHLMQSFSLVFMRIGLDEAADKDIERIKERV